jgi:hypothetical protein
MSSRSVNDKYLPDSGFAAGLNIAGGIPPASRNHLVPTGCDTPALIAAASLLIPVAINVQNSCRSLRVATGGRPGDRNGGLPHRSDRRFRMPIATSSVEVLRRPVESALRPAIAMVHQTTAMTRAPIVKRLLERIQHEAGVRCPAGAPADDPPGVRESTIITALTEPTPELCRSISARRARPG